MSSKRQRPWSRNGTPARPPLPSIPFDILLEILKRADTATFVGAAATAKPIRRAVLKPDFLRDMRALRADANRFDPGLLIGVSLAFIGDFCSYKYRATPIMSCPSLRFDAGLLETFEPVASRGELVVLRKRRPGYDSHPACLSVCHSLTGRARPLPPANVYAAYPPALLDVKDSGRSFPTTNCERKSSRRSTVSGTPSNRSSSSKPTSRSDQYPPFLVILRFTLLSLDTAPSSTGSAISG